MDRRIGASTSIPVEVVCLTPRVSLVARGSITRFTATSYTIDLDQDASELEADDRVILNFDDGETPRVIARVTHTEGNRLFCGKDQVRERERREFPRLLGGVPCRYRVVRGVETLREVADWLAGRPGPGQRGTWITPDPFMNFSVTGLRFDSPPGCQDEDLLLVEFDAGQGELHRCTARVIRAKPLDPADAADAFEGCTHSVAISFEQIPPEAEIALTAITLRIQQAML